MSRVKTETGPIAVFRATVVSAVSKTLELKPRGFTLEDIEPAIGGPSSTAKKRRIRHQLERMTDAGQLDRVERGLYVAGDHSITVEESDLAEAVRGAFRDAGGVMTMDDLLASLPHTISRRRNVLAYLAASDDFQTWLPIPGMRRHWLLRDDLRHRIPLSGEHQLLELRLLRMSKGSVPTGWGIDALGASRRRIAQGLKDARDLRDSEIATVVADPTLRRVLLERIAAVAAPAGGEQPDDAVLKLMTVHHESGTGALLEVLWEDLERGDTPACFQRILDVRCWDAIGAVLDLDAASLSRGALLRRS